ncbi:transcriptional regulator SlyA [Larsenimonas suaedae]|uniref:Transcriptional regulator SlyA n=1 Tax=Larsenimonas suaedae TaxID=1851019 RepID=A0ABU1GUA6_9GAMM|nr:transcriptional regulator SlyA [Larsenimonas suaedae]MCM2970910.1 transcriptional regulator SlyA [Larsenimonas suaedae]MDR5895619.1 transcriptional regulator SlyA [Larsenimonas suaedae]
MNETLCLKLTRIPRLWRAIIDERLAPLGLTQTRWTTLYHLSHYGEGLPQCELAKAIGVEAPSLVRTLDQLTQQSLIERRPSESDRRTKLVYLTPNAMPLLKQIESVVQQARVEMLAGLDQETLDQFDSILDAIEKNGQKLLCAEQGSTCDADEPQQVSS